ncbi:MAG: hypothetical protein RJB38_612 [Pseudomonadota bacterium]|jgi:dephospho-CoA kinase
MNEPTPIGFPVPVIGLTGGIGSGKSTAARILREKASIPVIDADLIARELASPGGKAEPAIRAAFGTLDRRELRQKIFSNPEAKATLEAILHPLIRDESSRRIAELARAGATLIFYEAALLVETGRYRDFDGLLVIEAQRETRIHRVMSRDQTSRSSAEAAIDAQASDEQRHHAAHWVLHNDRAEIDLERALLALLSEIQQFVAARSC